MENYLQLRLFCDMKLKDLRKQIKKELNTLDGYSYMVIDDCLWQIEEEYGIKARDKAVRDFKLDES